MTERPSGLHFQISKLLVAAVIVATAATGALIVSILSDMPSANPPGPGPGGGNGMPPPPPSMQPPVIFTIVTGFFVLSWLAVLVVFSRDQILLRLREQRDQIMTRVNEQQDLGPRLAALRAEIADDHARDMQALTERFAEMTAEYGEGRETDGYLKGMRTAAMNESPEANVRSFRRTPPQR